MDRTVVGEENVYFEMESKHETGARIYDEASESVAPQTKQTTFQNQETEKKSQVSIEPVHSCQADAAITKRLLCILTALVVVSFLTAAAMLVIALTMMTSRNVQTFSTDCASVQGSGSSVPNADYTELSKNVQDLKQNMSSLRETSVRPELKEMRKKYDDMRKKYDDIRKRCDEMRNKYDEIKTQVIALQGNNLSAESNKSESYSDKDNITALWQAIQTNRQEIIQLDQKDNMTTLWKAIQTNRNEMIQLDQKDNITTLWQAIQTNRKEMIQLDQKDNITTLWQAIRTNRQEIIQLDQKMINISKTQGPRGPPGPSGYNGTQGPPGKTGTSGSPGPSGPGNLSLCSYNKKTGDAPASAGSSASSDVSATETKGKKFLGVNCGTNDASVTTLSSRVLSDGRRSYICLCEKSVSSGVGTMYCYIHYWECPT